MNGTDFNHYLPTRAGIVALFLLAVFCGVGIECELARNENAELRAQLAKKQADTKELERTDGPEQPNVWVVNKVSLERGLLVKRNGDGTADVIVGHQFPPPPTRRVEKWYDHEFVVETAK